MTSSTKPTILIVEDDASTLAALERLFHQKFNILIFQNTDEALHEIKSNSDIAVVLSDYHLPKTTGLELFQLIHKSHPTIIKIILTGVLEAHELSLALQVGILHRVFRKPWENEFLILQMTEAIQQHQLLVDRENYEQLSLRDALTGLYNQRHFQNHLQIELERAKRHHRIISLIMIDVDLFKVINDSKGHPEGDRVLKSVALILQECVRNIDLVFRYAGDEFAVLLPDTDQSAAKDIAERIRLRAQQQLKNATLSLGVAAFPKDAQTIEELIQKADQALYLAKRKGKNQTIVAGED